MWTPLSRAQHRRCAARYPTDLTDAEWQILEPLLPAPQLFGRPRKGDIREIINAIFYVLRGAISWRLLPSDRPPWQTVYGWFAVLRDSFALVDTSSRTAQTFRTATQVAHC